MSEEDQPRIDQSVRVHTTHGVYTVDVYTDGIVLYLEDKEIFNTMGRKDKDG